MQYDLSIRKDNVEPYLDIAKDIKDRGNGLFTFILRINNGKIVDYNVLEYVNAKSKYLRLKELTLTELTLVYNTDQGTGDNALRPDDSQRDGSGWSS